MEMGDNYSYIHKRSGFGILAGILWIVICAVQGLGLWLLFENMKDVFRDLNTSLQRVFSVLAVISGIIATAAILGIVISCFMGKTKLLGNSLITTGSSVMAGFLLSLLSDIRSWNKFKNVFFNWKACPIFIGMLLIVIGCISVGLVARGLLKQRKAPKWFLGTVFTSIGCGLICSVYYSSTGNQGGDVVVMTSIIPAIASLALLCTMFCTGWYLHKLEEVVRSV